jgi:hypothetical protein
VAVLPEILGCLPVLAGQPAAPPVQAIAWKVRFAHHCPWTMMDRAVSNLNSTKNRNTAAKAGSWAGQKLCCLEEDVQTGSVDRK